MRPLCSPRTIRLATCTSSPRLATSRIVQPRSAVAVPARSIMSQPNWQITETVKQNAVLADTMQAMHRIAPLQLADTSFDNVGILLQAPPSEPREEKQGIMLAIDLTTAVCDELLASPDNVKVALVYHPIIFRGLKSITFADPQQTSLLRLAAAGVSVYCPHTSLDATPAGSTTGSAKSCRPRSRLSSSARTRRWTSSDKSRGRCSVRQRTRRADTRLQAWAGSSRSTSRRRLRRWSDASSRTSSSTMCRDARLPTRPSPPWPCVQARAPASLPASRRIFVSWPRWQTLWRAHLID